MLLVLFPRDFQVWFLNSLGSFQEETWAGQISVGSHLLFWPFWVGSVLLVIRLYGTHLGWAHKAILLHFKIIGPGFFQNLCLSPCPGPARNNTTHRPFGWVGWGWFEANLTQFQNGQPGSELNPNTYARSLYCILNRTHLNPTEFESGCFGFQAQTQKGCSSWAGVGPAQVSAKPTIICI